MSTLDSKHVTSIISLIWKSAEDCTKYNLPGGRKEAVITLACVSMNVCFCTGTGQAERGEGWEGQEEFYKGGNIEVRY